MNNFSERLRVVICIAKEDRTFLYDSIEILERQHKGFEIIGVTAGEDYKLYRNGNRIPFIPLKNLGTMENEFDIILLIGARQIGMSKICQATRKLKIDNRKLLGDWIVCIPGFTLEKYRHLQQSRLSIFAMSCFGGIISHLLGLPFRSPFINMFLDEEDYLRFLCQPRTYMNENLVFKDKKWEVTLKFDYPIFTLGDVEIHMNHYSDFDEAVSKWNERKQRINWYNIFVTAYTEDAKVLAAFDELPFGKKVCFVPFKSDLPSAWYINPKIRKTDQFWRVVNLYGSGDPFYYDPFDMLLYGKKTQLIDM